MVCHRQSRARREFGFRSAYPLNQHVAHFDFIVMASSMPVSLPSPAKALVPNNESPAAVMDTYFANSRRSIFAIVFTFFQSSVLFESKALITDKHGT